MKIFLSYASEDRLVAERIYFALVGENHQVFFDRTGVDAGEEFNRQIRSAIAGCERFVFLISPHSVERGGYTLTELRMAQARWSHPAAYVLPVMVADTDLALVPNYLKAVTVLEPHGDVAAEVAAELGRRKKHQPAFARVILLAVASLVVVGLIVAASTRGRLTRPPIVRIDAESIIPIPRSAFGYLYFPCPPRLPKCSQSFSKLDLGQPDTLDRNDLSKLIVREDNRDLGPAHSGHKDIGEFGRGRFSHWFEKLCGEYLYFSTSDNSDPRTNGRKYTVTVPGASAPPLVLDNSMFKKHEPPTFGYRYQGTGLNLSTPDSPEQPNVSRLVVLENGKALGPAHSNRNEIRDIGRGRYSYWHDGQAGWLYFSTSDNTDPRENGRTYEVSVDQDFPPAWTSQREAVPGACPYE